MVDEHPEEPVEDESPDDRPGPEVGVGEQHGEGQAKVRGIAAWRVATWVALTVYLALGYALAHRLWPGAGHRIIATNSHDEGLFAYFLEAVPRSVVHGHPFSIPWLNAPYGVSSLWNTTLFLPALLLWPVTALGGGLLTANVLLTVAPALSAWSAFLCLRRYVPSAPARFVGALVFGFSPASIHHALGGHLNLIMLWLLPPILLQVVRLCTGDGQPVRVGVWLGLLVVAQLLTGEEALAAAAIACLLLVLALAVCAPRRVPVRWKGVARGGGVAIVVVLVVAAWPLYEQFFGPLHQHGTAFVLDYYRNDLLSFTTATPALLQHTSVDVRVLSHLPGDLEEKGAFLGARLLLLLALLIIVFIKDLRVRVAAVAGIGLGVLSLGTTLLHGGKDTHIWLPWSLIHRLPLVEALLPNRLSLLVALFVGVIVAVAVAEVLKLQPWLTTLSLLAIGLCLLPLVPNPIAATKTEHVPAFFRNGTASRVLPHDGTVLVIPFPGLYPVEPELWQANADFGFRMPGGYFDGPREDGRVMIGARYRATSGLLTSLWFNGGRPNVTDEVRRNAATDLGFWGAHTVLLGPSSRYRDDLRRVLIELFGQPTRTYGSGQDEVEVWLDVSRPSGQR